MADDAAGAVRRTPRPADSSISLEQWHEDIGHRNREHARLSEDLRLALWLHAELKHKLAEEQAASYRMYARVFKALGVSVTAPWSGLADAAAAVVAERDALQARLDAVIKRITADPVACRSGAEHDVLAIIRGDHVANQWRPRAALQGDQPAEPKLRHVVGYDTSGELGDCLDDCPACEAEDAEPAVTPPDPSGRITNNGPIQPFEEGA